MNFSIRQDLLAEALDKLYGEKKLVAFIVATFGATDTFGIDDIAGIRRIIEDKAKQYSVPVPYLHVDAAVGWAICVFLEYNLSTNPLSFSDDALAVIAKAIKHAKTFKYADSATIDFHKMGWGHYPASAFIVNHRKDLKYLARSMEEVPYFSEAEYRHDPALFTLECSRPAIGPYSVMASLNGIGLTGYQILLAHAMEMAAYTKKRLDELDYCKVLNKECIGPHVTWWVLPKGRNAKMIYEQLVNGELSETNVQRFFLEIRRLFDKRNLAMNPEIDARLSFTNAAGYSPHKIAIPAWKAVFFNPKTDKQVIDDLIRSIEEL
jgi:glutamate/tyrosine decarboxylase-like PLP-dependent enzyme